MSDLTSSIQRGRVLLIIRYYGRTVMDDREIVLYSTLCDFFEREVFHAGQLPPVEEDFCMHTSSEARMLTNKLLDRIAMFIKGSN